MSNSLPGFHVYHQPWSLLKLRSIQSVMPSHHLIFFPPLLPPCLSQHQSLFQGVSSSHQVGKVLELQLQHQPSNEYSELISFRMDCFDLLAVPGDSQESSPAPQFKSINSLALIFFMVQFLFALFQSPSPSPSLQWSWNQLPCKDGSYENQQPGSP